VKTSNTIMKFSAPDWCFAAKAGCDAAEYYSRLKEIGYDTVEMVTPARRASAMAVGLEILNLAGPGMTEGLNRKEHHAALIPQLREAVEEAAATGVKAVIVFSGNRAGQFDSEGLCNCRTGLDAVIPLAEARGVELHLEAFNIYDHADYQADSLRYLFSLVRAVNSPVFKALLDIYHMEMMGEDCASAIPSHLPLVGHLHVAAARTRTVPEAGGGIDYARIVKAAVKAGYAGHWGMEFLPRGEVFAELAQARTLFLKYAGQ
jgi:hydroxypyruvate isomerase